MTSPTRSGPFAPSWGRRGLPALASAGAVAVLLLSTLGVGAALGLVPAPAHGAAVVHAGALHGPAPAIPHPLGPSSSGRGTFFVNSPVPFGARGGSSIYGTIQNNSNDPSLNLTTHGILGVAYNAWTNSTACGNVSAYAQVEVGFARSTNGGATWSGPAFLGNADCSLANQYANAWEPSLTSLANGTLVMAFIEFNTTPNSAPLPYVYFGQFGYWDVAFARLVVTESYDNGVTWSTPTTLNASANPTLSASNWIPERPWITAWGDTVYVSWMNYSQAPDGVYPSSTAGSSQVHLRVSVTGGLTWGSRIDLPDVAAGGAQQGINPFVLTGPTGTLYIAYATNLSWTYQAQCSTFCIYDVWTANVLVGTSTNNGTTFLLHNASRGVDGSFSGWGANAGFLYPAPQLALNPVNHQIYLAYTGGNPFVACTPNCYGTMEPDAFVTNSSTGGATWAAPHRVSTLLADAYGYNAYNAAIATTSDGVLHLETTWLPTGDPAICYLTYNCPQYQVYLNSSNNGATFTAPITIWANATDYPYLPDGEYDTMVSAGKVLYVGWSHEICTGVCYYPSATGGSQVTVSSVYNGTGVTLTYTETGLTPGTFWTVNVGGNPRGGNAPGLLSVSGVPPSATVNWTVGNIAAGYGIRYGSTPSIAPPANFTKNATIYENFSEQVLVNVTSNPFMPSCAVSAVQFCWDSPYNIRLNYNITPAPGPIWVPIGSTLSEAVTVNPIYGACTFCYLTFENLTFLSWTGTGSGSVNTTYPFINVTAKGPVNESANFRVVASCIDYSGYTPPLQCTTENATLWFHESGLPAATTWTVSAWGYGNQTTTNSSSTAWLGITSNVTVGLTSFAVWTLPDGVTGKYWVGTASPASPVELPAVRIVSVNFTAVLPTAATFSDTFRALGLPTPTTAWSPSVNNASYGVPAQNWTTSVPGGGTSVSAAPVYLTGGTSYYPSLITVVPFTVGAAWQNFSTLPASLSLKGPALVLVTFAPEYWLSITNSTGGTVAPASTWVHNGASVVLNATAGTGYYFVGWSGTGSGEVTTAATNPRVSPAGPVTELATFAPNPLPTWTVHIAVAGLPAGVAFTVGLGGTNFTGGAAYSASGLGSGLYALTLPYAYTNASELTRFVPSVANTSFPYAAGMLDITSNGWLNLTVGTEYFATLASTTGGTTTPSPGSLWVPAGTQQAITALNDTGYRFVGWNASGSGSVGGTNPTITVTANGPLWETAQFLPIPGRAPAVYTLTVHESGLPVGVNWSVSVGTTGAGGSASSVVVPGLNGSYTVTIPTLYDAAGTTRYVPDNASFVEDVTDNGSASVTFSTQYLLSVTGSAGGTVSAGGWQDRGATVSLTATPSGANYQFVNWTGSGSGSAAGASPTIAVTMNGPVAESATFAPVYPAPTTSGSSTAGQSTAILALLIALVAGLVIGVVVTRRRTPPPVQAWRPPASGSAGADASPAPDSGEVAEPTAAPEPAERPIYDEGI